jgi:hypothetical protein
MVVDLPKSFSDFVLLASGEVSTLQTANAVKWAAEQAPLDGPQVQIAQVEVFDNDYHI